MNNLEKFTPGEWHAEVEKDDDGGGVVVIRNDVAVEIGAICPQEDLNETSANIALIASAPEMYEALKDLMDAMDDVLYNADRVPDCIVAVAQEAMDKAKSAQKKARGEA